VIISDNGCDPARHKAIVQDLVENQHVLGFVGNIEVCSGPSAVDYLTAKRVPVVGLQGAEDWAYSSPMYFPQVTAGRAFDDSLFASWAQQAIPLGFRKFAVLACVEAQTCQKYYDMADAQTARRGLELVYKAKISLAQPDFTAECLRAKNAGAELVYVGADGNTQRRVVASCVRQNFRPTYVSFAQAVNHDMQDDPEINNHLIANSGTVPYFAENPATVEFRAALKQYGSQLAPAAGLMVGWVAGKLFERAAANISEPPTTAAILAGLWSINDDDLGGITRPLTFVENQNAQVKTCWWNVAILQAKWRSPDGLQRHCE
jgi:branched-chain amino acid transport system substrate-binding protein